MGSDFQERVRERAHQLWLQDGCPEGRGEEHWQQAQRDVLGTMSAAPTDPAPPDEPVDAAQAIAFSCTPEAPDAEVPSAPETGTLSDAEALPVPSTHLQRKGTTLLKLKLRQCRYIISETYSPAICCGAPTNGGSWCEEHRARVLVRSAVRPSRPEQRQPSTL